MRFNVKAAALKVSLVWGLLSAFATGFGNLLGPGYG